MLAGTSDGVCSILDTSTLLERGSLRHARFIDLRTDKPRPMSCARAEHRSHTVSYPAESFEERVENAEHGRCCEDEASDSELLKLGRVDLPFHLGTRGRTANAASRPTRRHSWIRRRGPREAPKIRTPRGRSLEKGRLGGQESRRQYHTAEPKTEGRRQNAEPRCAST